MEKTVLIINDEKLQSNSLKSQLAKLLPDEHFESYHSAEEIEHAIEHRFYMLAIIDIPVKESAINGIALAKRIFEINPIASIIVITTYREDFFKQFESILISGKVLDVISRQTNPTATASLIKPIIINYYQKIDQHASILNTSLLQHYSDVKNEKDPIKKGLQFERFISLLFGFLGYKEIRRRVIDSSRNEVDLVIRNEIKDPFLNKFGKYILLECKNRPDYTIGKNDFIIFNEKLKNSNGLAELGIIASTGGFAKTTYLEAMRGSGTANKVLFLSNVEFLSLIGADDKIEAFKKIIDEQMKNN
ncbi:MAG: restriction endonuclease [Pedobacter sp.]|nr:restriction endonuclease [Pedobacter sp.]